MAIQFACPTCQHAFKTDEKNAGRQATCPSCQNKVVIPGAAAANGATPGDQPERNPAINRAAAQPTAYYEQRPDQQSNPFASPLARPEGDVPEPISDVPPMPEVRQGVTFLYAGLLCQLLVGMVVGAISGALGAMAAGRGEVPDLQRIQWISMAISLLPTCLILFGAYKMLTARDEIGGKLLAQLALVSFAVVGLLGLTGPFVVIGTIASTVVASVAAIGNLFGWLCSALFLKRIAHHLGIERLQRSARNVAVLSVIIGLLQPAMMIFSNQAVQLMQNGPAAAPPNPLFGIVAMVVGLLSLVWLVMNARLLHFMRKAIPAA